MTLFERVKNKSGVEVSGIIKVGDKKVELIGEIHNREDNGFFKELIQHNLLEGKVVMCEHSTVLCHLHDSEHVLFRNSIGSEYIYFNLMKNGKKLICIDNRIEMGLLTSIDETLFIRFFESFISNPKFTEEYLKTLKDILMKIQKVIGNCMSLKDDYNILYEQEYTLLLEAVKRQWLILRMVLDKGSFLNKVGTLIDGQMNGVIISNVGLYMIQNIRKLGSLLVDINIIKKVMDSDKNDFVVFTGAAHVVRLVDSLEGSSLSKETSEEIVKLSSPYPLTTKSSELDFLEKLGM